jgi:DNA-directed RNA polymerase III subunit RPC3
MEPYERAFTILANQQYIRAVLPEHSRSTMDRFLAATEKETEKYTIMTAKDLQTAKLQARAQIDAEYGDMESVGMKRKAIDQLDMHVKVK